MKQQRYSVLICQDVDATTPEHAAREIAYRLIRWDEKTHGQLVLTVVDEEGNSVDLTTADYAPVFLWDEDGTGGVI